ncbi:MAG: thioredoxin domain-containing protein, partial [Acidobacteriota bacterium]
MSGVAKTNRLALETSPYLLLHQNNPVDWYPWGPEALERARDEDKPIFLSVGYATCYWCHVMERESFADAGTAQVMNEHFINIKVDREERPDLDEIYMAATQIFNQRGGWPNSVFLTPELTPFFAGTYFPPFDDQGRPSFRTVLRSMQHAWRERRGDVEEQAAELERAMRDMLEERGRPTPEVPGAAVVATSMAGLGERFDAEHGGFGGAPKFPMPPNLHLLLDLAEDGDAEAGAMLTLTLDRMARGGIYDQLAGGFHRYATDREWKVPHFEKMLYDNGQLLELYARDYGRTGDAERERIVRETAHFLARELTGEHGGLLSAIDAEVGGREGAFHAWTLEQIVDAVGEEDASFLAPILGFDGAPFFDGEYVLHLPEGLATQAEQRRLDADELRAQVKVLEGRLLEARERRPKPLVDDKVLTDWNGLTIAGLATAAALLSDGDLLAQADRAA